MTIVTNSNDRRDLLNLFTSLPFLQDYRGWRVLLESSGLFEVIQFINLNGPPLIIASEIISFLENYGRISTDYEALGALLNGIKNYFGNSSEKLDFIDRLLVKYNLMVPAKFSDEDVNWKSNNSLKDSLEKIIGENTLKDISFMKSALIASNSVVHINTGDWLGTGFMVSPKLLVTNNHVVPEKNISLRSEFRFNYQLSLEGIEESTESFKQNKSGFFYTNRELDFSLIELQGNPGKKWGFLKISFQVPQKGDRAYIIQHPNGLLKKISLQNNLIEYTDTKIVQYITSTMKGSSGSPVFNENWNVFALHHAGGMIEEPQSKRFFFRNEGIIMRSIIEAIPINIRNNLIINDD